MTELPPPNTRRWVARRKAAVVAAVANGMITIEEACRRYRMSDEEFLAWQRAFENGGILACIRNNAAFVPPVVRPLGRRRDAANGWASGSCPSCSALNDATLSIPVRGSATVWHVVCRARRLPAASAVP